MMNRCLSDKVLLMLHEGEELAREREHLERCSDCDRRISGWSTSSRKS